MWGQPVTTFFPFMVDLVLGRRWSSLNVHFSDASLPSSLSVCLSRFGPGLKQQPTQNKNAALIR